MTKLAEDPPSSKQELVNHSTTPEEMITNHTELPSDAATKHMRDLEQIGVHFANEHMFLAWIWTGMMLMGFGVVVAKMRITISSFSQFTGSALQPRANREIDPATMGMMFLVVGILTILMSGYRYLVVQNQLRRQTYSHADNFVLAFLVALILLSGTLVLLVLNLG